MDGYVVKTGNENDAVLASNILSGHLTPISQAFESFNGNGTGTPAITPKIHKFSKRCFQ